MWSRQSADLGFTCNDSIRWRSNLACFVLPYYVVIYTLCPPKTFNRETADRVMRSVYRLSADFDRRSYCSGWDTSGVIIWMSQHRYRCSPQLLTFICKCRCHVCWLSHATTQTRRALPALPLLSLYSSVYMFRFLMKSTSGQRRASKWVCLSVFYYRCG